MDLCWSNASYAYCREEKKGDPALSSQQAQLLVRREVAF